MTIRESKIATTPRSSIERIKRPVPCANIKAARGIEICIKPLPPPASTSAARADITGSSGRGKGMRSIATKMHAGPGTSTPCHKLKVPRRIDVSSLAKRSTSGPTASPRFCVMILMGNSARTFRRCRSAASTPRHEENKARVRPPAASMSSPSSVSASTLGPSRPGSGRCLGRYNIPWFAKSNGDPTSSICTLAGSISPSSTSASASSPTTKPILRAIASKPLPTVRVADVAITGVFVSRFALNTDETLSGARCNVEKVGSYQST